jgi:hypothetical protein
MNLIVDVSILLQRAVAPLMLSVVAALPQAHAASIAMVTDLQGKATVTSAGQTRDLTILAELDVASRVQLDAGATLVALYLDAGDEYLFKGPSTIEFKTGAPEVRSGAKPERSNLSLGKDVRIKAIGMAQAAVVMRSIGPDVRIQLLTLNQTRTLERSPEFRWTGLPPGQKYAFELEDQTGRIVFDTTLDTTSLRLPGSVLIAEGVPYRWKVSARLPDSSRYSSSAEFAVAAADLRARAEALRPPASAPLSTRIAYGAWLNEMGLKDEARKYWKAAAAERPADTRLKELSEQ